MEASPFIAFSLLLLVIIAVAALFMAGRTSNSANCDDPDKPGKKQEDHKFF
ncbi:MAG: single-stranded DNA-binding protein [Candidatus Thiodiazotropha sp. 6PLUC2]